MKDGDNAMSAGNQQERSDATEYPKSSETVR
jgi:hypothetical protein